MLSVLCSTFQNGLCEGDMEDGCVSRMLKSGLCVDMVWCDFMCICEVLCCDKYTSVGVLFIETIYSFDD